MEADKSKKLTFGELYTMGIGFTIGSAVFSLTGVAAMYTGGSTFLAYIVAAVAIVFMMFPVIIAGSVVPRQGVSYSLSKEAFNDSMGGFYFWIFFIGRIAAFANATAFALFFTSVFTTLNPKIVAASIAIIFYLTNFFGLKSAAKVQKILNIILFAALFTFIIFGIKNLNTMFVFNSEKFMAGAGTGFLNAISLLVFSLGGGMSVLELGGSVEDPEKNLPKVCFSVTLTVAVLFAGIALATVGALPIVGMPQGAGTPGTLLFHGPSNGVVNAANVIFSNGSPLLYFFIFGGMCLAVATTINGSYGWYSAACVRAAEDGWFPKWFAVTNRYGVPYRMQAIFVLFAIVPLFFVSDISAANTTFIKISTGLQILANIIPNFGLLSLPKLYPENWKSSRFYMSDTKLKIVTLVPSIASIIILYFNFSTYPSNVKLPLSIIVAIGAVYAFVGGKVIKNKKGKMGQQ